MDKFLSSDRVASAKEAMHRVYRGEYQSDRRPARIRNRVPTFGTDSSVQWVLNARLLDRTLWELATDRELGEFAASLLRAGSVSIIEDQLLQKPGYGLPVNMHQDRAYWPFSRSDQMVTAWIALMDMTNALGPIEILRGSHRWGLAERPKELIRGGESEWMDAVESVRPEGVPIEIVTAEVSTGGAVFFHSLTFHGSRRNLTSEPRQALSLHWAGDTCRMNLAETAKHDFPYSFARTVENGPIVNSYMPIVYP